MSLHYLSQNNNPRAAFNKMLTYHFVSLSMTRLYRVVLTFLTILLFTCLGDQHVLSPANYVCDRTRNKE